MATVAVFALVACTPGAGGDDTTASKPPATSGTETTAPSATPSAAPTATAAPPAAFNPDGTAEDNLPVFRGVVEQVAASDRKAEGRAYIDALVAAGFTDKAAMQLTPDQTTIGNPAESIQFSVLFKEQCLVGQVGPATGKPVVSLEAPVAGTLCLLGTTRPIDW